MVLLESEAVLEPIFGSSSAGLYDYIAGYSILPKTETTNLQNSRFNEMNNIYSVWLAIQKLQDDFVCVYGDLMFDEKILEKCLEIKNEIGLMVEPNTRDETMKVKIENKKICLSGFSQGCMMSINVGLTAENSFGSIVGFSGKIINAEDLKMRKKNNTNVLLIHGDQDDIVSPTHLLEAKDFLLREKVNVETHLIKNCAHHIPIEASSIALNYILKNQAVHPRV